MSLIKNIEGLQEGFKSSKKIVITTHHKPDGDAMGSSLALYNLFLRQNHDIHVVSPTDYAFFLHWMPGHSNVINFREQTVQSVKLIDMADFIFCVDFNRLERINELGEHVRKSRAKKILIDHHLDPEPFFDYAYVDPDSAASAVLVFDFIGEMGLKPLIDKSVAECLYAGVMTDTGSFRYATTTPKIHRLVADLLQYGVDASKIYSNVYDNFSERRMKFIGYCLMKKLQLFPEFRTALITVTREETEEYMIETGDTEGLVNYALSIRDVVLSVLIIDRKEKVKLSFRSRGNFPANELARYFNGGGHLNAAGGDLTTSLEDTVSRFIQILPEFKSRLHAV